jgi:hypothetical protein
MNSPIDPETLPTAPHVESESISIFTRVVPKAEMPVMGKQIADRLLETESGLAAYIRLYNASQVIQSALEVLKPLALVLAPAKPETILGAKVSTANLPRKWDYNGDAGLARMETELEELKNRIKNRQKFLQAMTKEMVDPDTGEFIKPATQISDGVTIKCEF